MTTPLPPDSDAFRRTDALVADEFSVLTDNDSRPPHRATAAVVEQQGEAPARLLYVAFAEYNARFVGGGLAAPLVLITQAACSRTLGDYCPKDLHGLESRIRILPFAVRRGMAFAIDVLVHEMIHAGQHELTGDLERSYQGHGPGFAAKCNAIGAELGLPPVGVKGRKGLPRLRLLAHERPARRLPPHAVQVAATPQEGRRPVRRQGRRGGLPLPPDPVEALRPIMWTLDAEMLDALAAVIAQERERR